MSYRDNELFLSGQSKEKKKENDQIQSIFWLREKINTIYSDPNTSETLFLSALKILSEVDQNNNLQSELFDLLGNFSLVEIALEHRNLLVRQAQDLGLLSNDQDYQNAMNSLEILELENEVESGGNIKIKRSKRNKSKNNQNKRHQKQTVLKFGMNQKEKRRNMTKENEQWLQFMKSKKRMDFEELDEMKVGKKTALPKNSHIIETEKFKEVIIDAPDPRLYQEELNKTEFIYINTLDQWSQPTFKGYTKLNLIQSRMYPTAYKTNENILVCAPTGAGKTNIALLTVLHEIKRHILGEDGYSATIDMNEFKIVYVAPMKALAAEVVDNFSKRLRYLKIKVRELTGDMQLTEKELNETQIIVTTPEKFDIVTRKATGSSLDSKVRLVIFDEVHLLNDDRGPVIETLVARLIRKVEMSQQMIRLVALSATLPNYKDVAQFLKVNPERGLFHFDRKFRPIPLKMVFIGVRDVKDILEQRNYDDFYNVRHLCRLRTAAERNKYYQNMVCFSKVVERIKSGHQVLVFVHSRKGTLNTAKFFLNQAQQTRTLEHFNNEIKNSDFKRSVKNIMNCKHYDLKNLALNGFGIHNAGLLRKDRNVMEKSFKLGLIKVLVTTATLAWGVNLPAHTVIIKGTGIYNPKKGDFVDVGALDIQQIFGRAGRPQFDKDGEAILITEENKLLKMVNMVTNQIPIESQFLDQLNDHLNAEIVLGTVSDLQEASSWLKSTYLYLRLIKNPMGYGSNYDQVFKDKSLNQFRREKILVAAKLLEENRMIRYDSTTESFYPTDLGRISSYYYLKWETIQKINKKMKKNMDLSQIFDLITYAEEFQNLKSRQEELAELAKIESSCCNYDVIAPLDSSSGKTNVLLQAWISNYRLSSFSLIVDSNYISKNAPRVLRGFFEISFKRGWGSVSTLLLTVAKMVEQRTWETQHPLLQFNNYIRLRPLIVNKLIEKNLDLNRIIDLSLNDLGFLIRNKVQARFIKDLSRKFPYFEIYPEVRPITSEILNIDLYLEAQFDWDFKVHGKRLAFWIWIEDFENERIYHSEYYTLSYDSWNDKWGKNSYKKKKRNQKKHKFNNDNNNNNNSNIDFVNDFIQTSNSNNNGEDDDDDYDENNDWEELYIKISFMIPIIEPRPNEYYIKFVSDTYLNCENIISVPLKDLVLPNQRTKHTDLLDLNPLHVSVLNNKNIEQIFKFPYFNPVQTQFFYVLYRTQFNVLLGAPTGSGKTVAAELAILQLLNQKHKNKTVVYIAPLKSLVTERVKDWKYKFEKLLGYKVAELTGDVMPDRKTLEGAQIIVTNPEKFDSITRGWKKRNYVKKINLIIIDEIHLLGNERGATLEILVSRMRYISSRTGAKLRFIGLSTALANAGDLAEWLNVPPQGLFNFKPSVRPVRLETHIRGFTGKFYCPRMASMNKHIYKAIINTKPNHPILVFVSSRRQTRLTAQDLISYTTMDLNPRKFLNCKESELNNALKRVKDKNLKLSLTFGIGLHSAGLSYSDKAIVEDLFRNLKILCLVSTSTLAWGVNLPAHTVIIKGTEYFDPKTKKYKNFEITELLQMCGRAGRPQFDHDGAKVIIMCKKSQKEFYKKFLFSPFPVESNLLSQLPNHLMAEINSGTISTKQDALEYLTWTYLFRRMILNPNYYGLKNFTKKQINGFFSQLLNQIFDKLIINNCIEYVKEEKDYNETDSQKKLRTTIFGQIATFYYLDYKTLNIFNEELEEDDLELSDLFEILCDATEFDEVPVRHSEDQTNEELSKRVRWRVFGNYGSPHNKANIILQAHFHQIKFAVPDYYSDLNSVIGQAIRTIQAMADVAFHYGHLSNTLKILKIPQMIVQGRWYDDSSLSILPGFESNHNLIKYLESQKIVALPQLMEINRDKLTKILTRSKCFEQRYLNKLFNTLKLFPKIQVKVFEKKLKIKQVKLKISLKYQNKYYDAYAPKFKKQKTLAWAVIIGDSSSDKIYFIKRVFFKNSIQISLEFDLDQIPKEENFQLDFYLISDKYIGLDQQYKINF
ncbi:activating signal cointegrator 1 complex subunit 3 [Anaeramoeba flamelloides]|uniref:Activating signal cointegrator 1 complex subunit 3 n=1 Tax=Anaeramoeba flamelloides TaxID=1746091 RepID=A0ABQ8YJ47_9EUKA|nr:activating signal cointegrator 1 complex subunit 3 [Anaeramoeba flamelloides]